MHNESLSRMNAATMRKEHTAAIWRLGVIVAIFAVWAACLYLVIKADPMGRFVKWVISMEQEPPNW